MSIMSDIWRRDDNGTMNQTIENLQLKLLRENFVKLRVSVKELIQEVRQHTGSQSELNELSALIRQKCNQLNVEVEELQKVHYESNPGEERKLMGKEVEEWKAQIHDDYHTFRNALLAAQIATTQRSKDELFGVDKDEVNESKDSSLRHREKMSRELMMKKSTLLTDDLLTVTRMIQDNTEKSTKTLDKLVESSQMVSTTQEELKTMGSVIGQAKKILSKYGRRENTDKLLIFLGLIFFLASCLVVIRNRFIFIF